MTLYPIFANLDQRPVLVIGGGAVATRKTLALLDARAAVTLIAPTLTPELNALLADGHIEWRDGDFDPQWMAGMWLVIAATDSPRINAAVYEAAQARRIFCNVVDDAEHSSFHVPSIVDRSPLIVAISSRGSAPVLARRLRERIETMFDHSLGHLAKLAAHYRPRIRTALPELGARRRFYDWLLDGPVAGLLRQQRPAQAEQALALALQNPGTPSQGSVSLVGAGPGDPGLLTLKALRALNEADVIFYDRLVSPAVLALARRDAEQISVGKQTGEDHHATQARIHQLMLSHAQAGRRMVRLKGGDAFIFGRGGEELEYLRAHAIPYEVIPGITAALACAAYAGIPLTHRDHSQSVQLITAHGRDDEDTLDWNGLARGKQTLAFYMGVGQVQRVSQRLIAHGRSAATPFALIENGSRPEQRVVCGPLHELAALAQRHAIEAPALLIIGEVAGFAETLHWFGQKPLAEEQRLAA